MTGAPPSSPLAVIGAGFSGTMAALQLLPRRSNKSILLCERGGRLARGVAYGTDEDWHLLNGRATNMSAFPDRPDNFLAWLDSQSAAVTSRFHATPAGTYMSRRLYSANLTQHRRGRGGGSAAHLVPDEVVDLVPAHRGVALSSASREGDLKLPIRRP